MPKKTTKNRQKDLEKSDFSSLSSFPSINDDPTMITFEGVKTNNLKNINISFPKGKITTITGVS